MARRLAILRSALRAVPLSSIPRIGRPILHPLPVLLVWCGFLFFYGLDVGTFYRTESLRAIIGAEALNGNWLVPTLYGEPFLTKPPGQYIAIALASLPFGHVTEVSARLPSALAATVAVLCFYAMVRRAVGKSEALLGAILLPVSLLWLDKAPSAEIDMLLVGWVMVALFCLLQALDCDDKMRWLWCVLALLAVTGGFLTKWTAPAFFYLTAIPFALVRKRLWVFWSWPHIAGIALAALIVIGWACAVAAETGWGLLVQTITQEASQRFALQSTKDNHWLEALTYPFAVLGANLPWSALALMSLRLSFHQLWDERGRHLLVFLHCWTWPNLLFWTCAAQHNVRYSLPMVPGLAGLGIMVCLGWTTGKLRCPVHPRYVLVALLLSWVVVKLVFVEVIIPARTAARQVRETAAGLTANIPLDEILYLCKLKDEGIMFYYGRPVRKLSAADPTRFRFAVLIEAEWNERERLGTVEAVRWLRDQQGAPIVLVRIAPRTSAP